MIFMIFLLAAVSTLILSIVFLIIKKEKSFIPILVISAVVLAICIISMFFPLRLMSKQSLNNNVLKDQIDIVESYINQIWI